MLQHWFRVLAAVAPRPVVVYLCGFTSEVKAHSYLADL